MANDLAPTNKPDVSIEQNGANLSVQSAYGQDDKLIQANNRKILSGFLTDPEVEAKEKFIVWLATPTAARYPKTQVALAKMIGVNTVTLSRWRHLPEFAAKVNAASRRYVSNRLSELVEAVFDDAVAGDRHAREMIFKYVLGWDDNRPAAFVAHNDNRMTVLIGGKPSNPLSIGVIDGRVGLIKPVLPAGNASSLPEMKSAG